MAKSSFNIAVTGMLAMGDKIAVIGNNIANSRTTAFKSSKLNFTEEFVTHAGRMPNGLQIQYGNGVRTGGTTSDWSPGNIEGTSNPANISISGDGFFPVNYQGSVLYTRAGDFSLVADNPSSPTSYYFKRPNGAILLGQTAPNAGITALNYVSFRTLGTAPFQAPSSYEISPSGVVTALPNNYSPAVPRAGDVIPDTPPYTLPANWDAMTPAQYTTWLGHMNNVYGANNYPLGVYNFYDPNAGVAPAVTNTAWLPGNLLANNGWREQGGLNMIIVDNPYVGVQRFNNPDALERIEGGLYKVTSDTSVATTNPAVPGDQGTGTIMQGALEASNTDLVTEFTDMIITQRAFQANSKTITTADEMLQTVLSLKR